GVVRATGEPARWCIGEIPPSNIYPSPVAPPRTPAAQVTALRQPHRHGAGPGDISRAGGGVARGDPHAARFDEGAELSESGAWPTDRRKPRPTVRFRCCAAVGLYGRVANEPKRICGRRSFGAWV